MSALITAAFFMLLTGSAFALPRSTAPAMCSSVNAPAGMTARRNTPVTVPINVDNLTGLDAISFDYTFTYNPATLTYTGFDQSSTVGSDLIITINSNTAGTLIVSGYGPNPMMGAGALIKLNFTATGPIGSTSGLNLPAFMFNEGTPCSMTSNGDLTIVSGTLSGVVNYANSMAFKPVPNTVISGAGTPNVSTNSALITGAYSLSGFGPGAYVVTPSKTGDVNGISGFDSGLIAQHVTNLITLNATQQLAADVSQAAGVTSFDAGLIARYVVSLPNFGITGSWIFNPPTRNYPNVETDQASQDYGAILMGEVSGDWVEPMMRQSDVTKHSAPQIAPEATVTLTTPVLQPAPINVPNIVVHINTTDLSFPTTGVDTISYQFILTYDQNVIIPQNPAVTVGGTISDNASVTVNQTVPGILNVVVFRANPIVGSGVLFDFRFSPAPGGLPGQISPLAWQSFQFNEGNPVDAETDGSVQLKIPTTAANVSIGGRLLSAFGQPVSNTRVNITDVNGVSRSTVSSSFGYYRFDNVTVGQTYIVSIKNRLFRFQPVAVSVSGELTKLNLIADP